MPCCSSHNTIATTSLAAAVACLIVATLSLCVRVSPVRAGEAAQRMPTELAIRWDPASGGPGSVEDVVRILDLAPGRTESFSVRYFTVKPPPDVSPGLQVIVRERTGDEGTISTYKVRGPARLRETGAFQRWTCPFENPRPEKAGLDLTWVSDGDPADAYARSCDADGPVAELLPQGFSAVPTTCKAEVQRWFSGHIRIERWTLADRRVILDVALDAKDSPVVISGFRDRAVRSLVAAGAQPLPGSKTEMGSHC